MIQDRGWNSLNGNWKGDEERAYTYIGPQGKCVIDYVMTNTEDLDKKCLTNRKRLFENFDYL